MKQLLLALSLVGLFVPGHAIAYSYDCFLVCTPARVYCQPSGVPMPPIAKICGVRKAIAPDSLTTSLSTFDESQATAPACVAQQVFDEDTQTYDWQMLCD